MEYQILNKDDFVYIYPKNIDLNKLESINELNNYIIIIKKITSKIPIPINNKKFKNTIKDIEHKSINNIVKKCLANIHKANNKKNCCDSINNNPNFISSLSHQIKTPLNGIISGLQIMNNENTANNKEKSIIKLLLKSSLDLTTYINDIIDYNLLADNKIKLTITKNNFATFIDNIYNAYLYETKSKNITFSKEININCPEIIYVDSRRLFQLLNNLLNNSVKFSQNEMIIFEVNYLSEEEMIEFKIIDTGSGISPNQINLIWKPFYQIKDNWLTNQEGIGLGLTITKYLVNLMDGTITIDSSIDSITKGTNITIKIPNKIKNIEISNLDTDDEVSTNKLLRLPLNNKLNSKTQYKFLIIDDNVINSTLLKLMINKKYQYLKSNDLVINIFNHSKEGFKEIITTNDYDIIFLDIKMPGFSGYDILESLFKKSNKQLAKIIIISALITNNINEKTKNYNIMGILPKPIQLVELEKFLPA